MIPNTNTILISKHQHPTEMSISVSAGESFTIPHLSGYKIDFKIIIIYF